MQTYVVSLSQIYLFLPVCRGISYTLDNFEWPLMYFPMFPSSPFFSQRCDGPEGVGGEAEAAAAGICSQGEHSGDETCNEGAGNARVHSMYRSCRSSFGSCR